MTFEIMVGVAVHFDVVSFETSGGRDANERLTRRGVFLSLDGTLVVGLCIKGASVAISFKIRRSGLSLMTINSWKSLFQFTLCCEMKKNHDPGTDRKYTDDLSPGMEDYNLAQVRDHPNKREKKIFSLPLN